jgi:hypothetical protein
LRHRLEATLITAGARPVPRSLRRRVLAATTRPTPAFLGAAAAVVLLFVVGILLATRPSSEQLDQSAAAPKAATTTTVASSATGSAGSAGAQFDSGAGSSSAGGDLAAPMANGSTAQASRSAAPSIAIGVLGSTDTDVGRGFRAYIDAVNATGGVNGHPISVVTESTGVATVNVAEGPVSRRPKGVLFETAFVDSARLGGDVVSLSSPVERQAHLAVAHAFPTDAIGSRAAIYVSDGAVWAVAADAFAAALEARHVAVTRVGASQLPDVPGVDANFLALSPADVDRWIRVVRTAPQRGVWGLGSAYDDRWAGAHDIDVLSPYAPIAGAEATQLVDALPSHELSAPAIHGWVTAKAIVELLRRNGGATITGADVDHLAGWDPAWAPPLEFRPGTRQRTPEAVLLRPKSKADPRYVADGSFERDP